MWFTYTMEYYLAMRKNEVMPFAATWMELESIMLNEVSQPKKDRYHVFTPMWNLRNFKRRPWGKGREKKLQRGREANHKRLLITENKLRVDRGWRRGENG